MKSGTKLDFETRTSYMVTLTATDSFGESVSIDVTITVTDVDEAPKISEGGLAITGPAGVDYAENGMGAVETYMATGPDADMAAWSLSGEDMSAFSFSNDGMLTFRSSPDYENPADMGMDNMYMVTITADDGTYMDTHDVMVRVTNEDEPGRVTFWRDGADATTAAIMVGDMLGGLAEDPDGNFGDTPPITDMYPNITGATWQWGKTMTPDMMDSWMDITGATDAAYTVMDADEGYHLRATAMYDDGEGMGKMASEETMMVMMTMNAAPVFESETDTREVAENTAAGLNVGAPVTAMDADNDTLIYSLGGTDMASFDIDPATGQIMVGDGTMLDYEGSQMTYMVTVTATDPSGALGTVAVTVMVTNVDEMGRVTFWRDGADATTAAIVVGDMLGGLVEDPDGNVGDTPPITDMYPDITGATWQWAKTMTPDMMDSWMDIGTGGMYTVMDDDEGYYLRATAMYDDGEGTGKMASEETMMVTMNAAPMFESETDTKEVAENTAAGLNVGAPVTAMDADNDTLIYSLGGTDMASFDIDPATGQIMVGDGTMLDYEGSQMTYMVTVTATDPSGALGTVAVTVMVTNVDEMGRVTFWRDGADATTAAIVVGDMLGGLVEDPDGNVGDTPPITDMYPDITGATWQWAKTMTPDMMDSWMDIGTGGMYTVMDDDEGYYLRATAMYDDGEGTGKMASEETMMVGAEAGDPLLAKYDGDKDRWIQLEEARVAVSDYFVVPKGSELSLKDARKVVGLYFLYKNRQQ